MTWEQGDRPADPDPGEEAVWVEEADDEQAGDEIGPGCPAFLQLGSNLRDLRTGAGMTLEALAAAIVPRPREAEHSWVWGIEAGRHQTGVLRALRLAGTFEVPIERLTEGIFWHPGEVAAKPRERRPPSERLAGYFSVVPAGVPAFEEPAETIAVGERTGVAAVIGRNVKEARDRRHLLQREFGLADTAGAGLIEAGEREPELSGLMTIARSLEVPPWFLLRGMTWEPDPATPPEPRRRGRRHDFHIHDDAVTRLWRDDLTATQIAAELGITGPSVEGIVRRLRARGVYLPSRSKGRRPDAAFAEVEEPAALAGGEEAWEATDDLIAVISGNLRSLRLNSGLGLQQLAEAVESNHSLIWHAENRGGDLALTTILRVAGSLKVPVSAITAGISWDPDRRILLADPGGKVDRPSAAEALGANIRRLRRGLHLSQEDLAAMTGIFRRHLSSIESGRAFPKPTTLLMLAGALEVEFAALFEGTYDWYVRPLPPPEYAEGEGPPSKAERQDLLLRLWGAGAGTAQIAKALDSKPSRVAGLIGEMRAVGIDVPYRNPPRSPAELAVRLRRRRRFTGNSAGSRWMAAPCPASCGHPAQVPDHGAAVPDLSREEAPYAPRGDPTPSRPRSAP